MCLFQTVSFVQSDIRAFLSFTFTTQTPTHFSQASYMPGPSISSPWRPNNTRPGVKNHEPTPSRNINCYCLQKFLFIWPANCSLLFLYGAKPKSGRWDSCGRLTSTSQRSLPAQHTTNTRDKHSCPQRDSNPRSKQPRDRRLNPLFMVYFAASSVVQTIRRCNARLHVSCWDLNWSIFLAFITEDITLCRRAGLQTTSLGAHITKKRTMSCVSSVGKRHLLFPICNTNPYHFNP